MPATDEIATRIERFLAEHRPPERRPSSDVRSLTGDASDRRYVRVHYDDAPPEVLAVYPGPITFATLPFANVAGLLHAMPVPIPRITAHSDALGIVALEDLGDLTLQARLASATPAEVRAHYLEALGLIRTLQTRGNDLASAEYLPYGLAFDTEKLLWELRFFVAHFLEAHRGAVLSDADRRGLDAECAAIAEELAAEPRVLCHRDYHSRNLMLHAGQLWVIDFQDARMGPDTYDLASLLRDSYVDLDPALLEELLAAFIGWRDPAPTVETLRTQRRRFDLMALQRNLKALGTFGFQAAQRGNPGYIQYVPRTLHYVRHTVSAYPRFETLRTLLADHLPELR